MAFNRSNVLALLWLVCCITATGPLHLATAQAQSDKKDEPAKFRIIDNQGRGVGDAKVEVLGLRGGGLDVPIPFRDKISELSTSTDEQGWFEVPGIAPSFIGRIQVTGQGIVSATITGASLEKADASKIVLVAQPARTIVGKVIDRISKKPMSNVVIAQSNGPLRAEVDDSGSFELSGLPAFKPLFLVATSTDKPYLPTNVPVPPMHGFDPTELEIELEPGVRVRAQVKDFADGKPATAAMYYFPTPENEKFQSFFESLQTQGPRPSGSTDPSGNASIVATTGPGVVVVVADGFPPNESVNKLSDQQRAMLAQVVGPQMTAVKQIDPKDLEDEIKVSFVVSKGRAIEVKLAGKKLGSSDRLVVHRGESKNTYGQTIQGTEFDAQQFHPGETREVLVHGPQLNLGAVLELKAEAQSPVMLKLEPTGGVKGCLVDENGEPQTGLVVTFEIADDDGFQEVATQIFTDANGRFEKPSLIASLDYRISAIRQTRNQQAMMDSPEVDTRWDLAKNLKVNSDEIIDLGSIVLGATEIPEPKRSPRTSTAASDGEFPSLIRGAITGQFGDPIANATITFNTWLGRSGNLLEDMKLAPTVLAQAKSDSNGNFQMSIEPSLEEKLTSTGDGQKNAAFVVVAQKHGTGQVRLADVVDPLNLNLKLNREMVVRGRVTAAAGTDLQNISLVSGSPVRVYDDQTLEKILSNLKAGDSLESIKRFDPVAILDPAVGGIPSVWPTSSDGRFLVRNIPLNAIFELHAITPAGQQKTIMVVSRPTGGFEFTLNDDSPETMQMQGSRVKLELKGK